MEQQEPKSKSAVKREFKSLQEFVRTLIELPDSQLQKLGLSSFVTDEIARARTMSKSALKRQIGFITKNMIDEPVDQARATLAAMKQPLARANAHFHQLESWRDQLIDGNEEVIEILVHRYQADRQKIRQLVRNAVREADREQAPKSSRLLFRYLRTLTAEEEETMFDPDASAQPPA